MNEIRSGATRAQSAGHDGEQHGPLSLGLFMPNCSNAYSISTYKPVPDDWTFEANAQIAHAAEAAGFDFLFRSPSGRATVARLTTLGLRSKR
jgi:hypothetical protein